MEQSNFQFALPTIGTDDMSRNDQGALIVNQATAAIVGAYLAHAASIYAEINKTGNLSNTTVIGRLEDLRVTPAELPTLINNVQTALRAF